MNVFIECEAGSKKRRSYDEKTLLLKKQTDLLVPYPFPYGFIMDTSSDDNDSLDCFIITRKLIKYGEIIECDPICALEFNEGNEKDYKVLGKRMDEDTVIDNNSIEIIKKFIIKIFKQFPDINISFGDVLNTVETNTLIKKRKST